MILANINLKKYKIYMNTFNKIYKRKFIQKFFVKLIIIFK